MADTVSGTFSDVGQSSAITGRKVAIKMDFATSSASVDVEQRIGSAWIKIDTGITADYSRVFESPVIEALRLNCTIHGTSPTDDVVYVMATGPEG